MGEVDRAVAMAASLRRAAARVGALPEEVEWLDRVHAVAMQPRLDRLDDDHHPAFLHPGRSALILMRDAEVSDAFVLATAVLLETRDADLRVEATELAGLGVELRAAVLMVPRPEDDDLAERLVTLPEGPRLAALAERLDHLRHEHVYHEQLGASTAHWQELHDQVGAVWLPVAERTHPVLAKRYAHWWRTFGRRLERS